ncbi:hypothetical protein N9D02_10740, partial [Emcibacteraceae bacterium]|nr:hypothetical protein [Emcibacteraceae bacterium]
GQSTNTKLLGNFHYKNGKLNGKGKLTKAGDIYEGEFLDGKFVNGKFKTVNRSVIEIKDTNEKKST